MSDPNSTSHDPVQGGNPREGGNGPGRPENHPAAEPHTEPTPVASASVASASGVVADGVHTVISSTPPCGVDRDLQELAPADFGKVLEGRQLDHFRLEEFIGGGGMGAVFRGLDTELNRIVAVKVLYGGTSVDDNVQRRFKNEAQSAARLDHDHIARVYFVGEDQGVHYIVFEYIDGVNVRDLVVQRGPLPLADVLNYTLQIADALAHASRRDVVHRDIKPSNVLVTPEGRAKLVDMGLARLHQVESPDHDLTASGVTLGTFDYISPEQARDPRNADVRSDIYSLGCTVFYMLTGKPPFPQGTVLQKLLQHQGDEPPDPRDTRPELPAEIVEITHRMLVKAPAERFQTAEEMMAELLNVTRRLGLPTAAPGSTIWVSTRHADDSLLSRHLPWLAPTVLLIATVFALDLFWYRSDSETDIPARPELTSQRPAAAAPAATPEADSKVTAEQPQPLVPAPAEGKMAASTPLGTPSPKPPARAPSSTPTSASHGHAASPPPSRPASVPAPGASPPPATPAAPTPLAVEMAVGRQQGEPATAVPPSDQAAAPGSAAAPGQAGRGAGQVASVPANRAERQAERQRDGTVVVAPDRAAETNVFPTLAAAVAAAASGDVIELQFNGPCDVQPVRLANKRLTVRAGKGFVPLLVFRPGPDDIYPARHVQSLITLLGGDLTLVGLHLEMDLPDGVATESLAMVTSRGGESVRIERCWLTIRNAAHYPGVAFLRIAAAPRTDALMSNPAADEQKPVEIRLEDCVIRGEATFLATTDQQPVRLFWKNGLLATPERLVELRTADATTGSGPDRSPLQIDLQHLTAYVGQGLLRADGLPGATSPPLWLACNDSIIIGDIDAPLIECDGAGYADHLDDLLVWQGDRNFYEGLYVFLLVRRGLDVPARQIDFDQWQELWTPPSRGHENLPQCDVVRWRNPVPPDRPADLQTPRDYALADRDEENPARDAATDGSDVGLRPETLVPTEE